MDLPILKYNTINVLSSNCLMMSIDCWVRIIKLNRRSTSLPPLSSSFSDIHLVIFTVYNKNIGNELSSIRMFSKQHLSSLSDHTSNTYIILAKLGTQVTCVHSLCIIKPFFRVTITRAKNTPRAVSPKINGAPDEFPPWLVIEASMA